MFSQKKKKKKKKQDAWLVDGEVGGFVGVGVTGDDKEMLYFIQKNP